MKKIILLLGIFACGVSNAQSVTSRQYKCGEFHLEMIANSMSKINGEFVTSQKIAPLGDSGMKMEMTLMPARDGNLYGFEYMHPDKSNRRWLTVELIRTNMEQPRIIGSFDCKRIGG